MYYIFYLLTLCSLKIHQPKFQLILIQRYWFLIFIFERIYFLADNEPFYVLSLILVELSVSASVLQICGTWENIVKNTFSNHSYLMIYGTNVFFHCTIESSKRSSGTFTHLRFQNWLSNCLTKFRLFDFSLVPYLSSSRLMFVLNRKCAIDLCCVSNRFLRVRFIIRT